MKSAVALVFAVVGSFAAGCGGPAQQVPWTGGDVTRATAPTTPTTPAPPPTSAPKPAPKRPAGLGRAPSLAAVRDAAIAAGFPCPNWVQDNVVTHADESGHCSGGDVFVWYASDARFVKGHEQMVANQRMIEEVLHRPADPLLVGPNWMITSKNVPKIQPQMGGTIEQ